MIHVILSFFLERQHTLEWEEDRGRGRDSALSVESNMESVSQP